MRASPLRDRFHLSPGCSLAFLAAGLAGSAFFSPVLADDLPELPAGGTHPFCGEEVLVTDFGQIRTPFETPPDAKFSFRSGLWVGAVADRGQGSVASVTTAVYAVEFVSESYTPRSGPSGGAIRVVYNDVDEAPWIPDEHEPLGIRVVQESVPVPHPSIDGVISVKYRIENISAEVEAPGWVLEDVYLGHMMDPDIGKFDTAFPWTDDHAAFAAAHVSDVTGPPGVALGDLGYAWDEPGNPSEDVETQLGIALPGGPAHRFASWASPLDPNNDLGRYQLLRGDSADDPTYDPPTTRARDHRILMGARRIDSIAPGESVGFAVALLCGDLVPDPPWTARDEEASAVLASVPGLDGITVGPNPIRLSSSAARSVAFGNLPRDSSVRVYSLGGRLVTAIDASRGSDVSWDLRSLGGERVPGGIYFYRVASPELGERTGKLVVLR